MAIRKITVLIFVFLIASTSFLVPAVEKTNVQNIKVTLLRASPGNLSALIAECKTLRSNNDGNLSIMRHSQGDHWDLMLLEPTDMTLTDQYYFKTQLAFQHSFIATTDFDWKSIRENTEQNSLYHIEMFNAAPGKYDELVKQRHMENTYYHAIQRAGNMVFETRFGNDMDVFTIGFYKDMITFATDPDLPNEVFEKAATDAGFKSRSTIGLYLRELLSSHNDTLAVRVD